MSQPFVLFPWDKPFLEHLQEYICNTCHNSLGASVIIVPHNRPRRYLTELLRQNTSLPRPAMLPRMLTIGEMTALFRAQHVQAFVENTSGNAILGRKAALLDCIHIMYRAVQEVALTLVENTDEDALALQLAQKDLADFLPWGMRLVSLFEEYMNQRIAVKDILYTEGEVSPMASALLGALGRIHTAYVALLQSEGWSTTGLEAFLAAAFVQDNPTAIPPLLMPCAEKNAHVFVAGFSTITECEHVLLHALWKQGAHICLHSDPQLASTFGGATTQASAASVHFSCEDHVTWLRRWRATCSLHLEPRGHKAKMHFLAGYDVHSQLLHMQEVLQPLTKAQASREHGTDSPVESTAVVLGSASLLMPTLHHLPDTDFNVSMGYPLEKSSLFSLIEAVMRLQEGARGGNMEEEASSPRRYYWRQVLHCLRHPFIQMLSMPCSSGQQGVTSLHSLWGHMEKALRTGHRFVSMEALMTMVDIHPEVQEPARQLFKSVLPCVMQNFVHVRTTHELGTALSTLCQCLLTYGSAFWQRYPLDAESLYRLMQHVIPTLKMAMLAHEDVPQRTLFALCRQLIGAERVPFEAAPMTGLQVLGMLETRLLHFDRVLVIDATDDALPGFSAQDPLLPDPLRQLVGLPALQERERVVAHTLYRLLASAKHVHFFWQEGMQRSALFDGKKSRSRFVDAFLWEEEQQRGYIIENDTPPLFSAPCPAAPMGQEWQHIQVNAQLRQQMTALLQKGISPTKIDTYLRCPQRFVWENIYKLRPLDEVNEGDDPAAVGELLHGVLHQVFRPWIGKEVPAGAISAEHMCQLFEEALAQSTVLQTLPSASLMLLRMAAPVRLQRFLEAQAEQAADTEIVALEEKLVTPLVGLFEQTFHITGQLDRVDTRLRNYGDDREEGLVVLDYKTGRLPRVSAKVWQDTHLWEAIGLWSHTAENSAEVLGLVADAFSSVQLPCYIYMCQQEYGEDVLDAALVDLGHSGKEMYLLGDKIPMDTRADIVDVRVPQLLTFLLNHMYTAASFPPREGAHCDYCPYGALCKR